MSDKMSARTIVRETGMSDRPEYYSGRGAILTDLNSDILENVHKGVQKYHGKSVAKQFVQMVKDIPKLSATDFLLAFYKLEENGWKWSKEMLGNERGVYVEDECSAMGTVLSVIGGMSKRDETSSIREDFLKKHGSRE